MQKVEAFWVTGGAKMCITAFQELWWWDLYWLYIYIYRKSYNNERQNTHTCWMKYWNSCGRIHVFVDVFVEHFGWVFPVHLFILSVLSHPNKFPSELPHRTNTHLQPRWQQASITRSGICRIRSIVASLSLLCSFVVLCAYFRTPHPLSDKLKI